LLRAGICIQEFSITRIQVICECVIRLGVYRGARIIYERAIIKLYIAATKGEVSNQRPTRLRCKGPLDLTVG
jgi:hypothetical protein